LLACYLSVTYALIVKCLAFFKPVHASSPSGLVPVQEDMVRCDDFCCALF
jgi:hypothetical protein